MKFSEQWLRSRVNPPITTDELCAGLTMAGLEVDAVEPVAPPLGHVVVGCVISIEPHPDADKLKVCQVDVGDATTLTIVCGAANVQEQGRYPVATIGAVLPGNFKIKKSKLRGIESFGMLCSEKELSLAEQAEGLMVLPEDAPVGMPVTEYLKLDDNSIELGLTPNRGDCLSLRGIAREAGVVFNTDVTTPDINETAAIIDEVFPVKLTAADQCPRYVGRVIRNIDPQASTPLWMKERLRRCGTRSISPVVDITNYVLLELGQPMHAFDLDKLQGGIEVRLATNGEKIELLDRQTVELTAGSLVIADDRQAQALAGIMGGNASAVSDSTRHIFLESAFFEPVNIAGRARSYGLHTDSSHRFERGVDPELQRIAMDRATGLVLEIVGGEPGPITDITVSDKLPVRSPVNLRHERLQRVLGVTIPRAAILEILVRLEMGVVETGEGWQVTAPGFRFDIEREVDLIEEIARIHGYDNIPGTHSRAAAEMLPLPERAIGLEQFQQTLIQRGYQEVITYSFVDPAIQALIDPEIEAIRLANPISADLSVMRTSLWPGLLQAAQFNLNRQQERVRIFESGLRFRKSGDDIKQEAMLSGLATGSQNPLQWSANDREIDFFDIKGDVEAILALTGRESGIIFFSQGHTALHPGQSACIVWRDQEQGIDQEIGWIGTLHPSTGQKLGIVKRVCLFEIRLGAITERVVPRYVPMSRFPAIKRDLAIVVDEAVDTRRVQDCIRNVADSMLASLTLFDVYRGKGIEPGKKSLAFGLSLQNPERTLTDGEVESVMSNIMLTLNNELGATLRDQV